ncbi:hypothetical protein KOM00_01995 [Geomonas sp. Red69]|uniref:hypothetical protein n=1 Tax=Geomonas diazotrophica TaxID=2843197 RepID=UPI001C11E2E9|nr:hypothetical protein [Geomonas diazotrophica]MBU5635498.1 hypothetical protein [Geomonas diazotrophica]
MSESLSDRMLQLVKQIGDLPDEGAIDTVLARTIIVGFMDVLMEVSSLYAGSLAVTHELAVKNDRLIQQNDKLITAAVRGPGTA